MVARLLRIALALALMSPIAPVAAQTDDGAAMASQAAKNMQNMVGSKFDGGLVISAIAAEGNVLVVTVNGASGWQGFPREQVVTPFLAGFCGSDDGKAFITHVALRVDTLDKGADLRKGSVATACPAAAAAAN